MKLNRFLQQNNYLFISIILFLLTYSLTAQPVDIKFRHLTIDHGLSQNSGYCIVQDNNGFIWIGTQAGLNRYDGYTFKIYESNYDNPNSLSNIFINSMYKDRNGIVWIGTEKGLNRFNPAKEQFTRYLHDPGDPNSISNNRIFSICGNNSGMLWIGTEDGLNTFDQRKNQFTCFKTDPDNANSISNNVIRSVYLDRSGVLWIGTYGGGLNRFDPEKKRFTCYKNRADDSNSLSNNYVLSICEDNSEILWIGTDGGGLNKFDREKEMFVSYKNMPEDPFSLSDNNVSVICQDRTGTLWIGTDNGGLNIFNPRNESFTCYQNDPNDPTSLSKNRIKSIYEDNNGGLWVGTRGGGINNYNRKEQKFTYYRHEPNNPNSLNDNMIWRIYEDHDGVLWIGTDEGGLNRFDREKNEFKHYKHEPRNPNSISYNRVIAICEDKAGVLWVGTNGGGLNRFDRETERFIRYKSDPNDRHSLSDNRVVCNYEDRSGILWIGTKGGGLNRFNRETGQFFHYKYNQDDPYSLGSNKVYTIGEDRSGVLWIGTFGGGLNKFDREKEQFTRYQSDPDNPNSLSDNFIMSFYEDKSGNLWIGTTNKGLNKFNPGKNSFIHFTKEDGLPDNAIYCILEDERGNLWVSTNKGISKFNPKTEEFKNYDMKDGLQSNEFNCGAGYRCKDGEMFFGGVNGFNAFFPDSIKDNQDIPPIVITDFQISNKTVPIGKMADGRSILDQPITETNEIVLSHKENVFSFEFSALNYLHPEKNQYAFMMEGLDDDWHFTGNRRFASYTGLPPGKYLFRVKGSNNDGVWNEEGTSVKITIIPPFWKTWWFYAVFIILIILLLAAISIYQVNRLKIQKEEEERQRITGIFSRVLEHGGDAAIYYRNFNSNKYDYMGNGIKDITGYDPGEFTLSLWEKIIIEKERTGDLAGLSLDEIFQRMRNGNVDHWVADIKIRTKSGEIRWARDITTATRDQSRNCYEIFGIMFDITDRKLAEQKLARISEELILKKQELENRVHERTKELINANREVVKEMGEHKKSLRALEEEQSYLNHLFESAPEGIAMSDENHIVQRVNKEFTKIFGYTQEDAVGRSIDDLVAPRELLEEAESLTKSLDEGNTASFESIRQRKDGKRIHVSVLVFPIKIGDKKMGHYGIYRDITGLIMAEEEKRELEDQLHHSQKMEAIGLLAGGIAHDFNNMLAVISGFSELIKRKFAPENPTLKEYIDRIFDAAMTSADLIAKLLAFARKGKFKVVEADVNSIIQTVIGILEHTIDKRINLTQQLKADNAIVMGDVAQLQNAILNIAVNAVDAMPNGGKLAFTTDTVILDKKYIKLHSSGIIPGTYLQMTIADTGTGMSEETITRIFEPFYTTKEAGKGTGLGLASVFGTIENHKGIIGVNSKVGKGTTFKIHLPLKNKGSEGSDAISDKVQRGSGKILIVDDEKDIRDVFEQMLIELGYTTVTCANGEEAAEYYKKNFKEIDLVILDVMMPKLNGYDCYVKLKKVNPDIKVIICSGYSINGGVSKIIKKGALGFIQKPFDINELSYAVYEAMGKGK